MVKLKHVYKAFGTKKVLCDIDLEVLEKKTTVIIGPSGCGKSTIFRILVKLIEADEGEVFVFNQNICTLDEKELFLYRQRIGFSFQSSALFDSLTVGENVGFSLYEHTHFSTTKIKQMVREKLKVVELEGTDEMYPAELSGGMQKRVSFARAIVRNPELLLYDEPTAGLDPITSTVIEDLIKSIEVQVGATSVVVTHQPSTIFRTGDKIVMLYEGNIIGSGTPEEMKNSKNPIVWNFLHGVPRSQ